MLPGTEIGAALAAIDPLKRRRHRHQLRHRPGRDERAPAPPRRSTAACRSPCLPNAGLPVGGRRQDALRPHARAAGATTSAASSPSSACRSSAAAAAPRPSTSGCSPTWRPTSRRRRAQPEHEAGATSIYSFVPFEQDAVVPDDRRAHQRQRLEEVPRGDARGRLGHLRGDGHRAGQGGRARPRRVRRLRRPRRHGRHGRDRQPLRHPGHRARSCSTPPSRRSWRPASSGLGGRAILNSANLEDGERRGLPPRPGVQAGQGVRRRRHLPAHRRGGPGPRRRVEDAGRPPHPRPRRRPLRPRAVATSSSTRSPSRSPPATRTSAATPWRRSRPSAASRPSCPASTPTLGLSNVSLRPQARRPPRPQLGVPARVPRRPGSTRAIVHAAKIMPLNRIPDEQREVCLDLIYDRRGADGALSDGDEATTRCRSCSTIFADVKVADGREGGPLRLAGRASGSQPAHHRRRPRRPHRRPRRGARPRASPPLDDHQRHPARRHEGRRRAVRLRARCSCRSCCSRPRR